VIEQMSMNPMPEMDIDIHKKKKEDYIKVHNINAESFNEIKVSPIQRIHEQDVF
jgi:hypothetical protein